MWLRAICLSLALLSSAPVWAEDLSFACPPPLPELRGSRYRIVSRFHGLYGAVNRAGGVHGRKIVIRAYDDSYNPIPAIRNTIKLIDDDNVFLLANYVGTPTVTRVLPLLKNYRKKHIYLFFPFTGAAPQREPPYSDLSSTCGHLMQTKRRDWSIISSGWGDEKLRFSIRRMLRQKRVGRCSKGAYRLWTDHRR